MNPSRKHLIAATLATLHLLVIGGYSLTAALGRKNLDPSSEERSKLLEMAMQRNLRLPWATYCRYTALEADYGFFSPDIGPAMAMEISVLLPGDRLERFDVPHKSPESHYRYQTALLALMGRQEWRELVARSNAARAIDKHPEAEAVMVKVKAFNLPSMEAWKTGDRGSWETAFRAIYANRRQRPASN